MSPAASLSASGCLSSLSTVGCSTSQHYLRSYTDSKDSRHIWLKNSAILRQKGVRRHCRRYLTADAVPTSSQNATAYDREEFTHKDLSPRFVATSFPLRHLCTFATAILLSLSIALHTPALVPPPSDEDTFNNVPETISGKFQEIS